MLKILFNKNIRDFRNNFPEFSSIFILTFIALAVFSGLFSVSLGMSREFNDYANKTNLSDYWVAVMNSEKISNLKDKKIIESVQKQYTFNTGLDSSVEKNLQITVLTENKISRFESLSGSKFSNTEKGIWIDKNYLKANKLGIGDHVSFNFNNKNVRLKILGGIESPDYIGYTGQNSSLMPNHKRYGYAYTNVISIPTNHIVNQVLIKTNNNYTDNEIRETIEDTLGDSVLSIVSRSENTNISKFTDKITSIQKLSIMFCLVLFSIVFLTTNTTMQRLVESQRDIIGTFRALGFSKLIIIIHYLVYPIVTIAISGVIGLCVGPNILGDFILDQQKSLFNMPYWETVQSIVYVYVLILLLFIAILIVISTLLKMLKGSPAEILENKTSGIKASSNAFIYKLFTVLGWEWNWVLRDKARSKLKETIGILGIVGSLLLLIASFGIKNSLEYTNQYTYGSVFNYKEELKLSNNVEIDSLKDLLNKVGDEKQQIEQFSVSVRTSKKQTLSYATVISPGIYINLMNTKGSQVNLEEKQGVFITSQIAKKLNLKRGSKIALKSPKMNGLEYVTVLDILKVSAPQGIYMSREYFEELGNEFIPTTIYTGKSVSDGIKNSSIVSEVNTLSQNRKAANQVLDSFQSILVMLIVFSLILSWFVLYNLGMLNYSERYREYATLRVLGFKLNEVRSIILKDSILTWLIGTVIGLPVSLIFLNSYVQIANTSTTEFFMHINMITVVGAVAIILLNSIVISMVVSRQVKRIQMSVALKSIK